MVRLEANGVPKHGRNLPFVNQSGLLAPKKQSWVEPCKPDVLLALARFGHIENALAYLLGGGGLSAPFRTFDENRALTPQLPVEEPIGDAGPIFFFFSHK